MRRMARFSTFRFAPPADGLVVSAPSIRSQIPPVASGLPPLPRGIRQWGQAAKAALWSRCAPPPPPQIPLQQLVRYPSPHLCVSQCTTARASTSGSRPNETRASHAASAAAPCARHELQRDGEMHRSGRRANTGPMLARRCHWTRLSSRRPRRRSLPRPCSVASARGRPSPTSANHRPGRQSLQPRPSLRPGWRWRRRRRQTRAKKQRRKSLARDFGGWRGRWRWRAGTRRRGRECDSSMRTSTSWRERGCPMAVREAATSRLAMGGPPPTRSERVLSCACTCTPPL